MRQIIQFLLLFTVGFCAVSCSKQGVKENENTGSDTTGTGGGTNTDTLGHSILIYGTTATGGDHDSGCIFTLRGDGSGFKVVYSFHTQDGYSPFATLCKAANGKLYGTTTGGGINNQGTVFSFDPANNTFKKLVDFNSVVSGQSDPVDLTAASNGLLYGGSGQFFFSLNPSTDKFTILHKSDFYTEGNISNCIQGKDGKLYGISYNGGARVTPGDTSGIIYSYDIDKNSFKRLYTFTKPSGMSPVNRLCAAADGNLYGLTHEGGANNNGVIFKYSPLSGTYTKLVDLTGTYGRSPVLRNHLEEWNNLLYGVAFSGNNYPGCLFSYNISTNAQALLYKPENAELSTYLAGPVSLLMTTDGLIYINGINTTCAIMRYDIVTKARKIVFLFPDAKTTIFSGLIQY